MQITCVNTEPFGSPQTPNLIMKLLLCLNWLTIVGKSSRKIGVLSRSHKKTPFNSSDSKPKSESASHCIYN